MNDRNRSPLAGKIKTYPKMLLCLGSGLFYLVAGQPARTPAAVREKAAPEPKRRHLGRLLDELNARCASRSLLDRLKEGPAAPDLLAADKPLPLNGSDNCPGTQINAGVYTDSGTTLGANNTVAAVPANCNGNYTQTAGPDVIYQFRLPPLASRAATCSITVDPTGANWDPSIYVLRTCGDGSTCAAGRDAVGSNGTETITDAQMDALPAGTYYLFVDSFYTAGALSAGTYDLTYNCQFVSAANVSIGGRVLAPAGGGLSRVGVTATDAGGQTRYAVTNSFGYYRFDDLPTGQTFVFEVASKKYRFANPTRVVAVTDSISDLDFNAIE